MAAGKTVRLLHWLTWGLAKFGNPARMQTGRGLRGFWTRGVEIPEGQTSAPIAFEWYRQFIQCLLDGGHYARFAPQISIGDTLVGIALLLGAFTGIASFFGGFMNWNFMMAGTASINPLLFTLSVLLILAWRTAGWWGLDRWLLPLRGTPWLPRKLFQRKGEPEQTQDTGPKKP